MIFKPRSFSNRHVLLTRFCDIFCWSISIQSRLNGVSFLSPKLQSLHTQSFKTIIKINWINQLMITSKLSHNFPRSFSLHGIITRVFVYILAVKILKMSHCQCANSSRAVIANSWLDLYCKLSLSRWFYLLKFLTMKFCVHYESGLKTPIKISYSSF